MISQIRLIGNERPSDKQPKLYKAVNKITVTAEELATVGKGLKRRFVRPRHGSTSGYFEPTPEQIQIMTGQLRALKGLPPREYQ